MTTLVRWTPFGELGLMERRMRRMLEDVGFGPMPAADVYETEDVFVVELEVPGFEKPELSLEVSDHTLTVTGEAASDEEERGKAFILHERLAQAFERRFQLPEDADTEKIVATFDSGLLEVRVPKSEKTAPRTVQIGIPPER
jgi:HSP20 family protein